MVIRIHKKGSDEIGAIKRWLFFKVYRYLKHPLCLFKHGNPDADEIGTDGNTLDYYCWRCGKRIKQVPAKGNLDFYRLKRYLEENGEGFLDSEKSEEE